MWDRGHQRVYYGHLEQKVSGRCVWVRARDGTLCASSCLLVASEATVLQLVLVLAWVHAGVILTGPFPSASWSVVLPYSWSYWTHVVWGLGNLGCHCMAECQPAFLPRFSPVCVRSKLASDRCPSHPLLHLPWCCLGLLPARYYWGTAYSATRCAWEPLSLPAPRPRFQWEEINYSCTDCSELWLCACPAPSHSAPCVAGDAVGAPAMSGPGDAGRAVCCPLHMAIHLLVITVISIGKKSSDPQANLGCSARSSAPDGSSSNEGRSDVNS